MPQVNSFLFVGVVALVLGFESSSNLAAAYGISVTGMMVATTALVYLLCRRVFGWGRLPSIAITAAFLAIDLSFFLATIVKVPHGGWVSILVAAVVFLVISVWVRERRVALRRTETDETPLADFVARIVEKQKAGEKPNGTRRVSGTAVFLSARSDLVPHALLHNVKHNHVLHERIAIVTVDIGDRPWVPLAERVESEKLGAGFYRIVVHYGFMQQPNLPAVMEQCDGQEGFIADPMQTSYFLGRDKFVPGSGAYGFGRWRRMIFIFLQRNAVGAADFFRIPPNRTVELGTQIEI